MNREETINLLRAFNENMEQGPADQVERFRKMPLAVALADLRGFVPDESLDSILASVGEHRIEWDDITDDVYSVAASFIVSALMPGEKR